MTEQELSNAIVSVRTRYIEDGESPSYYEINNGLCENFALDVIQVLQHPDNLYDVCGENFMRDDNDYPENWDWSLLHKNFDIKPPAGLSASEVDQIAMGGHVFLMAKIDSKHKFYDSECPKGVESFFDLPVFRRQIVVALRLKGISADEVLPEDVVPPPLCPFPNPTLEKSKRFNNDMNYGM
jgi:hypothetical protein